MTSNYGDQVKIPAVLAYIFYPVLNIYLLYLLSRQSGIIITKRIAWQVFIAVSAPGTFVHEASHAIVACLFGHRIVSFQPFIFDLASGTLGSVQTQYSKHRAVHLVGVFCMAVAPLFIGTLLIFWLLNLLVPNADEMVAHIANISQQVCAWNFESLKEGIVAMAALGGVLFDSGNLASPLFWIFLPISFSIAIQLVPSRRDFQNMVPGAIGLGILILIIGSSDRFGLVDHYFYWLGDMLNGMLTLTLVFSVLYFLITVAAAGIITFLCRRLAP